MHSLLKNIRFYVLTSGILLSFGIYFFIVTVTQAGVIQVIKLEQIYSFLSLVYLYFSLLAGPFCYRFHSFPWREEYLKARRAIGVLAFYFAFLHFVLTFFGQLDGFSGLGFLDNKYLLALFLGAVGLLILFLLTVTSLDYAVKKMKFKNWKLLHRLVYFAGILILVHVLMLGSHYSDLSAIIPQLTFFALAFLLILEAPRFDKLIKKIIRVPQFSLSVLITLVLISTFYFAFLFPFTPKTNGTFSFDIHAAHRQLAKEVAANQINTNNIPGLQGDKTLRYTVNFIKPDVIVPNQDTTLRFEVYNAANGSKVTFFKLDYGKVMHLIIVNNELTYFAHIHPTLTDNGFVITTQFPKPDIYRLYLNFLPLGAIEQQVGFSLPVGFDGDIRDTFPKDKPDTNLTKVFGDYEVTLDTHGPLNASEMTLGNEKLSFTVKDAKTKKPITTLKPFMQAFGHLTMINEQTYDYIHVHPSNLTPPPPNANGGPTVDFLPIGIYGPFKPGIYKAFAEFSTKIGEDFDTDFTIKVN